MNNHIIEEDKKSAWQLHIEATQPQFASPEISLGPWTSFSLIQDPKHLSFVLARYKFCAKMLHGKDRVVEIGCGDGFGIPIIAQSVNHLHCIDWDERNIEGCRTRLHHLKNVSYQYIDLNKEELKLQADAAYSVDVIEHLEPSSETFFIENICNFLKKEGVLLTGTPNITASAYASKGSEIQHINLKNMRSLRELTARYFKHVFMFGMNDEVLHTGYDAMCHYLWSIGAEKR